MLKREGSLWRMYEVTDFALVQLKCQNIFLLINFMSGIPNLLLYNQCFDIKGNIFNIFSLNYIISILHKNTFLQIILIMVFNCWCYFSFLAFGSAILVNMCFLWACHSKLVSTGPRAEVSGTLWNIRIISGSNTGRYS